MFQAAQVYAEIAPCKYTQYSSQALCTDAPSQACLQNTSAWDQELLPV